MSEPLNYTLSDAVAHIELNRPEVLNALDTPALARLADTVERAALEPEARAVLLSGAGRAFCAGGDLKHMLGAWAQDKSESDKSESDRSESPQTGALEGAGHLHRAISGLRRTPKPVVCAVNGAAAGAGVGLALAGDIVWAAASASFTLAYTAIGLSPDGGTTFFLTRAVGPTRAVEYFLTNRKIDAEEALRVGLISRVVPEEALFTEAQKLARKLAQGPASAFAEVKQLVSASLRSGLEEQLESERQAIARSVATADFREGVQAFAEKRRPQFK